MTDTTIRFEANENDPKIDFEKIFSIVSKFNLKNTIIEVGDEVENLILKAYVNNQGSVNWINVDHKPFKLLNVPDYYHIGSFDRGPLDDGEGVTLFISNTNDKYEVDEKAIKKVVKEVVKKIFDSAEEIL